MEKVRYMISDAANLINVEAHVLRYWEEELELTIPRNEMGHRYYTRENIQEFQKIKDLKEQGYQLKAIRMLLHNGNAEELQRLAQPKAAAEKETDDPPVSADTPGIITPPILQPPTLPPGQQPVTQPQPMPTPVQQPAIPPEGSTSAGERMAQFRELMSDIVGHAIALNNEELSLTIGQEVQERVLKEMNYLMREQEEAQEERYKKLDAAIRGNIRRKKLFFRKADKASGTENAALPNPAGSAT